MYSAKVRDRLQTLVFVSRFKVFGNILFNYAVVVSIPSWINEKKPGASVNWTIWLTGKMISTFATTHAHVTQIQCASICVSLETDVPRRYQYDLT